jgi:hypothetical protein
VGLTPGALLALRRGDLAALAGLAGIVAGVLVLGPTDLGFDRAAAISAILR